jgi:7-carboxy-7-deazaguanine synthase
MNESLNLHGRTSCGYISEVFSGIQGEGLYVGERQIFVRFAGCNLKCRYCDTPSAQDRTDTCRIEQCPGRRDFAVVDSAVDLSRLLNAVERLEAFSGLHHSIAITGGEPLVQSSFLGEVAGGLKGRGLRVFLETNGSLPDRLPLVIQSVDIVSMDVKLPSASGLPDMMAVHEEFLRAAAAMDVYVKIVLASTTTADELLCAVRMVNSVDASIPVVLQPVTGLSSVRPPSAAQVLEWQSSCRQLHRDVRVIPQCHKFMGQL